MTDPTRGRAHLEALLNRAEKVVRVSPADTLVLMGVEDTRNPVEFAHFFQMMENHGVEAAGIVILGPGMDLDSIDMNQLARAYAAAGETPVGEHMKSVGQYEASTAEIECPRGCGEIIPLSITVEIRDDGKNMVGKANVEGSDLGLHQMLCTGSSTPDV